MKMEHKIIANLMGATVVACLLLAPKAHAAEGDGLLAAALTAHAVDLAQTLEISRSCREGGGYSETNPLLGRCPSQGKVLAYFAGTAAALTLAHYKFESHNTTKAWLAVELLAVGNNYRIGLRGRF